MLRPICLHVVSFHRDDQRVVTNLGHALYAVLTRPLDEPLTFGSGIPVYWWRDPSHVSFGDHHQHLVFPVLGTRTWHSEPKRQAVIARLRAWHRQANVVVSGIARTEQWNELRNFPGGRPRVLLGNSLDDTLDAVLARTANLLSGTDGAPLLLISGHGETTWIGDELTAATSPVVGRRGVFKRVDWLESVGDLNDGSVLSDSAIVAVVVGDDSAAHRMQSDDMIRAKHAGFPILMVDAVSEAQSRSSRYGGNVQRIVWAGDIDPILRAAAQEWIHHVSFRRVGHRLADEVGLTNPLLFTRPPELVDMVGSAVPLDKTTSLIYPDPELSALEQAALSAQAPNLRLITPSTAFRYRSPRADSKDDAERRQLTGPSVVNPLEDMTVGLSVSTNLYTDRESDPELVHVDDALVHLARGLASSGATLAYGGDLRTNGLTFLLAELLRNHNQTSSLPVERLHLYVHGGVQESVPSEFPATVHDLRVRSEAAFFSRARDVPPSLHVSDMRRRMSDDVDVRILLSGQSLPRSKNEPGYIGAWPGILEEAWWACGAETPTYILGGFGGAAELVAELFLGDGDLPVEVCSASLAQNPRFRKTAKAIAGSRHREMLELPEGVEAMAIAVRCFGRSVLESDERAIEWNGLNIAQNKELMTTTDALRIANLVLRGMLTRRRAQMRGRLTVEVVRGDLMRASQLDAVALAAFDDLPLTGMLATLDKATGGVVSTRLKEGRRSLSVSHRRLASPEVIVPSLGRTDDSASTETRTHIAAEEFAQIVLRRGLSRVGVVLFGGSLDFKQAQVTAMINGLGALAGAGVTVVWYEANVSRHRSLHGWLKQSRAVDVSTAVPRSLTSQLEVAEKTLVKVTFSDERLRATLFPAKGTGVVLDQRSPLTTKALRSFGGGGPDGETPMMKTLDTRGRKLRRHLFGDDGDAILLANRHAPIVVAHDVESAQLPFEALVSTDGRVVPSSAKGLSRQLVVNESDVRALHRGPRTGDQLRVLLVVNPLCDLDGADVEGKRVEHLLRSMPDVDIVDPLYREAATTEAVMAALLDVDVLHFCGHGFFEGPKLGDSGLCLANDELLTTENLRASERLPRVLFLNACEAGKVHAGGIRSGADGPEQPTGFAEHILRAGVETFIGNRWLVGDEAADVFSDVTYRSVVGGASLGEAIAKARKRLRRGGHEDWANYRLYGNSDFRLR